MTKIKTGDQVTVEYEGKLSDGSIFDKSSGRPLKFQVGQQEVIPGFDKAVLGMQMQQEKIFTIPVADAYGPVNPQLIQQFPRDQLPPKSEPKVGMTLIMQGPEGYQVPAKIIKVDAQSVTVDVNHPLAGKDLTFKIKVVGINDVGQQVEEMESCCGSGGCGSGSCGSSGGGCGSGGCGSGGCGSGGCGH